VVRTLIHVMEIGEEKATISLLPSGREGSLKKKKGKGIKGRYKKGVPKDFYRPTFERGSGSKNNKGGVRAVYLLRGQLKQT